MSDYAVRAARPDDEAPLRRMLEHASPEDIHLRFFHHLRSFPHPLLDAMLRVDNDRHFAFVATPLGEPATLAGTAMLTVEPDGRAAEFGIIVDRAHAGRRLGTRLMHRVLEEARAHGVAAVYGVILRQNPEMIDLVRRLGFRVNPDRDDPGCVRAELALAAPVGAARSA